MLKSLKNFKKSFKENTRFFFPPSLPKTEIMMYPSGIKRNVAIGSDAFQGLEMAFISVKKHLKLDLPGH